MEAIALNQNSAPPQLGEFHCACSQNAPGTHKPPFVYGLGRIEPRFPSLGVEKEFAQAIGRALTTGLSDRQAFHEVLTQRHNRYLVHQLSWVLTVEGIETYVLQPRESTDFESLIETVRPAPSRLDVDVVIGLRGPAASLAGCSARLPTVIFDQIYSFDRDELLAKLPCPDPRDGARNGVPDAAAEVLDRVMQLADNTGASDEHRALNYLAVRYPAIHCAAAEYHARNFSLSAVEVRISRLSGLRKIVDVIFTYTHREADVAEQRYARVDVTEEFPFLVTKLSPYFDR